MVRHSRRHRRPYDGDADHRREITMVPIAALRNIILDR